MIFLYSHGIPVAYHIKLHEELPAPSAINPGTKHFVATGFIDTTPTEKVIRFEIKSTIEDFKNSAQNA
jgi:hypothetical protein